MKEHDNPVILLIDDEPTIRETFCQYLKNNDYHVVVAEDGDDGLDIFRTGNIDLILLDLKMPGKDGIQIMLEAREHDKHIPVIVISGSADIKDVVNAMRQGATDYLMKPVDNMSILFFSIERGLERARLQRENLEYQTKLEQKVHEKTEEIKRVNNRLREVVESSKRLLGCGEINESGRVILEEFGRHMNAGGGSIYQVMEDGLQLLHSLDPGHAEAFLPFPLRVGSPFAKALNTNEPFYTVNIRSDTSINTSGYHNYRDDSVLFFPIQDRISKTIAIIALHNKQDPPFISQDREVGTILASFAGELIQTARVESELRRSENHLLQAQKMEAVGTLAGGIAHDFNNILSAIIGYTDLSLYSESLQPDIRKNLEQIQRAGSRARDLVQQILSFSRAEEYQHVAVDISPIVKEVVKLMRAAIPSNISITERVEKGLGSIMVEPTRIHQVLINLCTNAAHAISDRGGEISISCTSLPRHEYPEELEKFDSEYCLCMSVEDNGCGVEPAAISRIFEPYFTTKQKGEGTGLGLAVVHGIVTKSGGMIKVSSEPGKGSIFTLYFPFAEKIPRAVPGIIEAGLPSGSEKILFVDDEVTLGDVAGEILGKLGYKVEILNSSVEALARIRAYPEYFDLLITDQTMPVLSGVELAREALELKPGLPVILYTGFSTAIDGEEARKMGISEFLMKPVSMEELARVVRRILDRKSESES